MRTRLLSAVAALTVAAGVFAAGVADAHHHRYGRGAAIVGGALAGGLLLGALANRPYRAPYADPYYAPPPRYYRPAPRRYAPPPRYYEPEPQYYDQGYAPGAYEEPYYEGPYYGRPPTVIGKDGNPTVLHPGYPYVRPYTRHKERDGPVRD